MKFASEQGVPAEAQALKPSEPPAAPRPSSAAKNQASCPDRVTRKHDFRSIPAKSPERMTTSSPVTPYRGSILTRTRSLT